MSEGVTGSTRVSEWVGGWVGERVMAAGDWEVFMYFLF